MLRMLATAFAAGFIYAVPVLAAQRTFVASNGVDSNPCSLVNPCRAFAAAILLTDPNGEIVVLDSAGYGPVTVTKPVSIISPAGVYAGVSVPAAQDGITVNAGVGDKVVLRGLSINGQGGNNGIVVTVAGQVSIENCVIANMGVDGVRINGGSFVNVADSTLRSNGNIGLDVLAGAAQIQVDDSRISNNGSAGIFMSTGGGLTLNRVSVQNNGLSGLQINPSSAATVNATVLDSAFTGNSGSGVIAFANLAGVILHVSVAGSASLRNGGNGFRAEGSTGSTTFVISNSVGNDNGGNGLVASGAGTIVSTSGGTYSRNLGFGFFQASGALLRSHGNNAVNNNTLSETSGSITTIGLI